MRSTRDPLSTRPLPWVATALALGTLGGMRAGQGHPLVALGTLALSLVALSVRARGAVLLGCLALLAFARGWILAPPMPKVDGAEIERARDEPVVGIWRAEGAPGSGFVEPCGVAAAIGHRILFETRMEVPREGEWVAVLPGREPRPWPRGPVPGPRARDGRFLGTSLVHPDELVLRPPQDPWRTSRMRFHLRRWIDGVRTRIRSGVEGLESSGEARGLIRSLVLGEREGLSSDTRDLFTRTGTAHLLAVSGLNVSLLFVAFAGLTRLVARFVAPLFIGAMRAMPALRAAQGVRSCELCGVLITLILLLFYTWVVGGGAPVVRASTSLGLAVFAPMLPSVRGRANPRRADSLSLWSAALAFESLAEPRELAHVSLQLSYLATLGILLGTKPLQSLLSEAWFSCGGRRGMARVEIRPSAIAIGILLRRGMRLALLSLAASIAATLFTLPIVWSCFGEVSPAGVFVTPLVAPLLALLLVLSWVGVFLPLDGLAVVVGFLAEVLHGSLALADGLPGTPTPLPLRPAPLVVLVLALMILALLQQSARAGRTRAVARLGALGGGFLLLPWCAGPQGLEIHALAAGHGSSFLIRGPGLSALVFDAGSRDRRELYDQALAPVLARWEVARPWIALSHDHGDHLSALPKLLERYRPKVWLGALPARLGERLPHAIPAFGPDTGESVVLRPSWPRVPLALTLIRGSSEAGTEGSCSLGVTWGAERILLSGDAEEHALEQALAQGWIEKPLRLLSLPHHGSSTPLLGRLLAETTPGEVWISCGERPPVASELERRRIAFAWTGAGEPLALFLPWPQAEPVR